MTSTLIAVGVFVVLVALLAWGTRVAVRGGPWVARVAPAMKSFQESAFVTSRHPGTRFVVEERRKQAIIRTDQAQGDPPLGIDLDAGTVAPRRPPTVHP